MIREALHKRYASYAEQLTATSVIDALYAIGFLGVCRGNGVVYGATPSGPSSRTRRTCVSIPASGPLPAAGASDSTVHTGRVYQTMVGAQNHTASLRKVSTTDAGFQADRHVRLLEETALALSRLQRQLARSDMPVEPHAEVREGIDLLNEQINALPLPGSRLTPDMVEDLLGDVAERLVRSHARLNDLGLRDEPAARRLAHEARALRRALAGAVGSGRGSDSSG